MMKTKKALSLVLVFAMLLALVPAALAADATYTDVPESHWAYSYVEDVTAKGLMNGVGDGTFALNSTMTRAMFVTVLARMSGENLYNEEPSAYADVPSGQWYTGAVNWAGEANIVNGYPDGTFKPMDAVTREQAATLLIRYAEYMDLDLPQDKDVPAYTDADEIASWARVAVEGCSAAGILSGYPDGSFQPKNAITRAEAAKVLSTFLVAANTEPADPPVVPEPPEEPTEPSEEPTEPTPTEPVPTEPEPTVPSEPEEPTEPEEFYTITFVGENGYAKYEGQKVTEIQVSSKETYVEFGIYGEYENGYELDSAAASAGALDQAGNIFVLSQFSGDVTVNFTTRFRTVYINYVISPNWNNNYIETPQAVTWGTAPERPTVNRVGHHVKEWYYDQEYTQQFDFEQPLTEDVTLYGEWSRNIYTVTFMVDGEVYDVQQVEHGYKASAVANPTKDNYIFNGWYYDEDCTQPYNRTSDSIGADTTVYAGWVEAKLNYVYLNGSTGNDENSGATAADAVKTFARAKELLADAAYKEIRITGQIKVTGTEVWDLSEYPDAVVYRDESFKSYLFWVTGDLTLSNITIDGGAKRWAAEDGTPFEGYMLFNCTGGVVTMNAGTELCNSHTGSYSSGGVGYLHNATLTINDGVKIHDCDGGYAGVFGGSATNGPSTIVMNGGEIYNNYAYKKPTSATSSSTASAVITVIGSSTKGCSTFTMNGGKIYNNWVEGEDFTYGSGAIYLYYGQFIMNGGEIYNNSGISASVIRAYGASKAIASVELNGGKIYNNTATLGETDVEIRTYANMVINNEDVLQDGSYWVQNNANAYPITIGKALTNPLNVTFEALVYNRVLFQGTDTYQLTDSDLALINLSNEMPDAYKLTLDTENNNIYLGRSREIGTAIYMSAAGNDANDGLSVETAVATFARAKELLIANQSATGDNVIFVVGGTATGTPSVINITGEETWSLKGIPNAYMQADPSSKASGYMFYVTGTLTLEDIVIDGNLYYNTNKCSGFRVDKEVNADKDDEDLNRGVLNLKSGAVLRNFSYYGVYVYGGTLNMYEGSKITNVPNNGSYGIYVTGSLLASGVDNRSTVNIYGGELSECYHGMNVLAETTLNISGGLFTKNGGACNPGGAVLYCSSASAVINISGGTFTDNHLTGTGNMAVGTIYYGTDTSTLNITGGTFTNNTCAKDPNANGFAFNNSAAANNATVHVKADGTTLDLSGAPFYWAVNDDSSSVTIDSALTGNVKVAFKAAPAAGQVVAKGTESYALTEADLAKVACLNEGITLKLDTEKNAIVVADPE